MTKSEKKRIMELTGDFNEYLINKLLDPEFASEYINAVIEDGDAAHFLHALGNVVKARGMSKVTKTAGINRENAYKSISKEGNPTIKNVTAILDAVGLRLRTEPVTKRTRRR